MRGNAAAAFALLIISSAGYADDLPRYDPEGAPTTAAPTAPNWTGFYVGGSVDYTTDDKLGGTMAGPGQQQNGGFAGGHMGYNQQTGPFVFGVEGTVSRFGR
jgi:hypothetical protein